MSEFTNTKTGDYEDVRFVNGRPAINRKYISEGKKENKEEAPHFLVIKKLFHNSEGTFARAIM